MTREERAELVAELRVPHPWHAFQQGQGIPLTQIVDTVYNADGSTASGTLLISWPAFTTAGGQVVAAGSMSVKLGANGGFSTALAPNTGASPTGTYYRVVYQTTAMPGAAKEEYWVVPQTQTTTIAAVRARLVPANVAAEFLTRDQAETNYVHAAGDQTVAGVKTFTQPPSVPTPQNGTDAANKSYVDTHATGGGIGYSVPQQYASIQAAITAAAAGNGPVQIQPNYQGTDSYTNTGSGPEVQDWRQSANAIAPAQQIVSLDQKFGTKPDGKWLWTCATTSGSRNLTCSGGNFTAADVGKLLVVYGGGAGSGHVIAGPAYAGGGSGGKANTWQEVLFNDANDGCTTQPRGSIQIDANGVPTGTVTILNYGVGCTALPTTGTVGTVTGRVVFSGGGLGHNNISTTIAAVTDAAHIAMATTAGNTGSYPIGYGSDNRAAFQAYANSYKGNVSGAGSALNASWVTLNGVYFVSGCVDFHQFNGRMSGMGAGSVSALSGTIVVYAGSTQNDCIFNIRDGLDSRIERIHFYGNSTYQPDALRFTHMLADDGSQINSYHYIDQNVFGFDYTAAGPDWYTGDFNVGHCIYATTDIGNSDFYYLPANRCNGAAIGLEVDNANATEWKFGTWLGSYNGTGFNCGASCQADVLWFGNNITDLELGTHGTMRSGGTVGKLYIKSFGSEGSQQMLKLSANHPPAAWYLKIDNGSFQITNAIVAASNGVRPVLDFSQSSGWPALELNRFEFVSAPPWYGGTENWVVHVGSPGSCKNSVPTKLNQIAGLNPLLNLMIEGNPYCPGKIMAQPFEFSTLNEGIGRVADIKMYPPNFGFSLFQHEEVGSNIVTGNVTVAQVVSPSLYAGGGALGTTGSTTYQYQVTSVVGISPNQTEAPPQTTITVSNGNAILNASNKNYIGWELPKGAEGFYVYKYAGNSYQCLSKNGSSCYYFTFYDSVDYGGFPYPAMTIYDDGSWSLVNHQPPSSNVTGQVSASSVSATAVNAGSATVTAGSAGDPNWNSMRQSVQATGEADPLDFLKADGTLNERAMWFLPWYHMPNWAPGILTVAAPADIYELVGGITALGRYNSYPVPDPGAGTCTVSHTGGGGSGATYHVRFVDANSGYSLASPACSDAQGYAPAQLDATHKNTVHYQQPGGYSNAIVDRGDAQNSVVSTPNHVAYGVLSEITACGAKNGCDWTDDGSWPSTTLANLAGAFYANPDANTTSSMILGGRLFAQNGQHLTGGTIWEGQFTGGYLSDPLPPAVTPNTTGTTTYTYYVVYHDYGMGTTKPSAAATITNGSVTPNNTISWNCSPSFSSADLLKGDTAHALATNLPCSGANTNGSATSYSYRDTGQTLVAYVAPTRNSTGDLQVHGAVNGGYDGSMSYLNGGLALSGGSLWMGNAVLSDTARNVSVANLTASGDASVRSIVGHEYFVSKYASVQAAIDAAYNNGSVPGDAIVVDDRMSPYVGPGWIVKDSVTLKLAATTYTINGTVQYNNGVANVTAGIISMPGSHIVGSGTSANHGTNIKAANGLNADLIATSTVGTGTGQNAQWWHWGSLEGFHMDGNKTQQTAGNCINVENMGETAVLRGIEAGNCFADDLKLEGNFATQSEIANVTVNSAGQYGVDLDNFQGVGVLRGLSGDSNATSIIRFNGNQSATLTVLGLKSEEEVSGHDPLITIDMMADGSQPALYLVGGYTYGRAGLHDVIKVVNGKSGATPFVQVSNFYVDPNYVNAVNDTVNGRTFAAANMNKVPFSYLPTGAYMSGQAFTFAPGTFIQAGTTALTEIFGSSTDGSSMIAAQGNGDGTSYYTGGLKFGIPNRAQYGTSPEMMARMGSRFLGAGQGYDMNTWVFVPIWKTGDASNRWIGEPNQRWPEVYAADVNSTTATVGTLNVTSCNGCGSGQVNADWNASSGVAQILNKPTLATVATSGSYNDLTNKPAIPAQGSHLISGSLQGPTAAVTGTGSMTSVYSVTFPAGTFSTGMGVKCFARARHTTGSASVSVGWKLGSTTYSYPSASTTGTTGSDFSIEIFTFSSLTTETVNVPWAALGGTTEAPYSGLSWSENLGNAATLSFTFSVANTDKVTGDSFYCMTVQ